MTTTIPGRVHLKDLIEAGAQMSSSVLVDEVMVWLPSPWVTLWLDRAHVAMALWAPEEEAP